MKRLAIVTAFSIMAVLIFFIAVLSVQNYTLISLQFLWFRSIEMPLGILMAFSLALGFLLGAIIPFVKVNHPQRNQPW